MRTDLEARAEVQSLNALHEKRRTLLIEWAPLAALHGNFGMADDRRKMMVEAQKVKARMALEASGSKITEGMVDANAYSSPEYVAYLDIALADKVRYLQLQTEMQEIEELIRDRDISLQIYAKEVGLAR